MGTFIFQNQKSRSNSIELPNNYDIEENNTITGLFTMDSIRFYKKRLEDYFTYEHILESDPSIDYQKIRMFLRYFRSAMADFDIKENKIMINSARTEQSKQYDFSKGLYIVKCSDFMDVVPESNLTTYLENYGFDESVEEDIVNNQVSIKSRVKDKEINFRLRH